MDKKVAFLDVDKVLISVFGIIELMRRIAEIYKEKNAHFSQMLENNQRFTRGELGYDAVVDKNIRLFISALKGLRVADVERIGQALFDLRKCEWYYSYTKELISLLRKLGFEVVLVTASPLEIIDPLAQDLDIAPKDVFTLVCGVDKRAAYYDGTIVFNPGAKSQKKQCLLDYAEQYGIDLKSSLAVTDGAGDIPMLQAVGLAIALNPDPRLREEAEKQGWPIVESDMDVIVQMQKIILEFLKP